MSMVQSPLATGRSALLLDAADGALLPRRSDPAGLQLHEPDCRAYFSYNRSFRDIGNVTGPLVGAGISASFGFAPSLS